MLFSLDNEEIFNDYFNIDSDDLDPEEGFYLGNMFLDEYIPYKNYKPFKINPKNEKEALLMKIRMYDFAVNDLNLKLDLEPNNTKLYKLFKKYNEKLMMLVKEYESKYEVLDLNHDMKERYTWYKGPWPWEGERRNV